MIRRLYLFFVILVLSCSSALSALPGVSPYIPDTSGTYVYYRDTTFNRESYTGFLYYNESTYAVRYYAPQNKDKLLPEESVELLFTIDPKQDHVEMTGERILSSLVPDETEIVNYLHDMMYELASRRKKAGTISPETEKAGLPFTESGIRIQEDFPQFGGTVNLLFDYNVPLFNLKSISGKDGTILFQAVTAGILKSSDDTSFSQFTGIPEKLVDSDHESDHKTKDKPVTFLFPEKQEKGQLSQTLKLDEGWKQSMENLWLLGNSAVLSVNIIALPEKEQAVFMDRLTRKMLLSSENSYSVWKDLSVTESENRLMISSIYYQNKEGNVTRDFKILTKTGNSTCAYFTLTVFDSVYRANKGYFDSILKNYSVSR